MNLCVASIAQLSAVDIERGCMRHSTVIPSDQLSVCSVSAAIHTHARGLDS